MTDKELMESVAGAKEFLEAEWYNVAYIGIYGSQNYWLAEYSEEYQSDIDFKAVIVPSLDDLVYNSKPVSTTIEFGAGQIDLKDVRVFTDTLVKCNPAYIETLYTPYFLCSEDYKLIMNVREQLVEEMGAFLLKAAYGMILEKVKAFSHPYPSIKNKIDKYWYDPKQLHHILRLYILMGKYVTYGEFNMNLWDEDRQKLLDIKKGNIQISAAERLRDKYSAKAKDIREQYTVEPRFEAKALVEKLSRNLIKNRIVNQYKKKSKPRAYWGSSCPRCGSEHLRRSIDIMGYRCRECWLDITTLQF